MTTLHQHEDLLEKISTLLDGELNDFETRRLLRQLDQLTVEDRAEVYSHWQRMQVYSSALQNESGKLGLEDFFEEQATATDFAQADDLNTAGSSFVERVAEAIGANANEAESDASELAAFSEKSESASVQYLDDELTTSASALPASSQAAQNANPGAPLWSKMAVAASVALAVVVGFQQLQINDRTDQLLAAQSAAQQNVIAGAGGENSAALISASVAELDAAQAELLAEIESASSMSEQLAAQQRLIEFLRTQRRPTDNIDPFARVANFEELAKPAQ